MVSDGFSDEIFHTIVLPSFSISIQTLLNGEPNPLLRCFVSLFPDSSRIFTCHAVCFISVLLLW